VLRRSTSCKAGNTTRGAQLEAGISEILWALASAGSVREDAKSMAAQAGVSVRTTSRCRRRQETAAVLHESL